MKRETSRKLGMPSEQELNELGKAAQNELARLLEENPQIKEFQNGIEIQLETAGNYTNRMAALGSAFRLLNIIRQNGRIYLAEYI